jgi:predicted nucleotidyltransferase component of viral defense system
MINKTEIEQRSQDFEVHTSNIQRDYLFGWFLHYIFAHSRFKDTLFLKGGNALRKAYFLQTRFSTDLDFGAPYDVDVSLLKQELKKACEYIHERTGVQFVEERNTVEEKFNRWNEPRWQVFEAKIYFKDFYGMADHITLKISLDVTRFDRNYLPIQNVELLHPYSDSAEVNTVIRCMKLEEILATKLKCMLQREHAPDLFDFVYGIYLNHDIPLNKNEVRRVFLRRTIFESNPSMAKRILLNLPLEFLKAKWSKTIVCAHNRLIDADDAISNFVFQISGLFSDVPDRSYNDHLYYGPNLRNKILQAGRTLTLLRVVYNNAERLVEPYSLKFLEKLDGTAREYLYVWDRVGSKNNPGIKMFLPENISLLENTKDTFSPREGQEVELCRAGEYPENRYLYDREKKTARALQKCYKTTRKRPSIIRRSASRLSSYGPKYIFQCSSCGKRFYRKSHNSTVKPHKRKGGTSTCYGYGIYVGMKY